MNTMPGPALPVSVVTSGPVVGGPAIPVYGYSAAPTDGRAVSGGPATRVKVLSASDLVANGGTFYLVGAPLAMPVITAGASTPVAGGPVIAVYPVNAGWPSNPVLPQVASSTLLLDLRASQLVLSDGAPVVTWADASGNGSNFTRGAGSNGLTKQSSGGVPYVDFNGVDDWMLGPNIADNLDSFAVFASVNINSNSSGYNIVAKYYKNTPNQRGWVLEDSVPEFLMQQDGSNYIDTGGIGTAIYDAPVILTGEMPDRTLLNVYQNGALNPNSGIVVGTLSDYGTAAPLNLGCAINDNNLPGFTAFIQARYYALLIYAPAPNATDRAAIETWLATNP